MDSCFSFFCPLCFIIYTLFCLTPMSLRSSFLLFKLSDKTEKKSHSASPDLNLQCTNMTDLSATSMLGLKSGSDGVLWPAGSYGIFQTLLVWCACWMKFSRCSVCGFSFFSHHLTSHSLFEILPFSGQAVFCSYRLSLCKVHARFQCDICCFYQINNT